MDLEEIQAGLPYIDLQGYNEEGGKLIDIKHYPDSFILRNQLFVYDKGEGFFLDKSRVMPDSFDGHIHPRLENYAGMHKGHWEWRNDFTIVFVYDGVYLTPHYRRLHCESFQQTCWYDNEGDVFAYNHEFVNCSLCLSYMKLGQGSYYIIVYDFSDRPIGFIPTESSNAESQLKTWGFRPKQREKIISVKGFSSIRTPLFYAKKFKKEEDHTEVFEMKRMLRKDSSKRWIEYLERKYTKGVDS